MGDSASSVSLVGDFYGIKLYSDESVERGEVDFHLPPLGQSYEHVLYKDIVFNHTLGLWARLYLPNASPPTPTRLPVILYFHAGGFCLFTPRSPVMHRFCVKWAADAGALIVSVHHRLAPEHRLPAAYHDSVSALQWLHSQSKTTGGGERSDPWFDSPCRLLQGIPLGRKLRREHRATPGNVVWQTRLGWRYANKRNDSAVSLFAGEARSASETREKQGTSPFTLEDSDAFWRMALPMGSNRDHHFCNPLAPQNGALDVWSLSGPLPPTVMVIAGLDILRSKQLEYCELLKKCGEQIIEIVEFEEEEHAFALLKMDGQNSIKVIEYASNFIKFAA